MVVMSASMRPDAEPDSDSESASFPAARVLSAFPRVCWSWCAESGADSRRGRPEPPRGRTEDWRPAFPTARASSTPPKRASFMWRSKSEPPRGRTEDWRPTSTRASFRSAQVSSTQPGRAGQQSLPADPTKLTRSTLRTLERAFASAQCDSATASTMSGSSTTSDLSSRTASAARCQGIEITVMPGRRGPRAPLPRASCPDRDIISHVAPSDKVPPLEENDTCLCFVRVTCGSKAQWPACRRRHRLQRQVRVGDIYSAPCGAPAAA
mmetsp:Transcript_124875/g.353453  ORF Transcript_124875/g.353453 Transcript_124875/m.353453 type:complete len:266 (-) Transcript_124875:61-858(-)